jgi:hypothetical protein
MKPQLVSGNPEVIKEANMKKGGRAKKKRAAGGKIVGLMTGGAAPVRADKARRFGGGVPGRKQGGAVGANRSPLSTAHSVTPAESDG